MSTWIGTAVVYGPAAAQGSKSLGRNRATGAPMLLDADKRLKSWRGELKWLMKQTAPPAPLDEAIRVTLTIYVPRPKAHFGTGRNAHVLKPDADVFPGTGRDIDKVARAVLDAGTAIWWRDDSRVCDLIIVRRYGASERVEVTAEVMSAQPSLSV